MSASTLKSSKERLWPALRRIFQISRPYRRRLYAALLFTSLGALVGLAVPLGLRALIDAVFEPAIARF